MEHKPLKPFDQMTPAEQEVVRQFCYEIAMALRRITGRAKDIAPEDLPVPVGEWEENSNDEPPKQKAK